MEKPFEGPPRWTGNFVENPDLNGILIPFINQTPFTILIDNCDDHFLVVFTTKEKLDTYINHPAIQGVIKNSLDSFISSYSFNIKQVHDVRAFVESVIPHARIMLDPEIINPRHTKWLEIIKDGDQIKYRDPEGQQERP